MKCLVIRILLHRYILPPRRGGKMPPQFDAGSAVKIAQDLLSTNDEGFVRESRRFAEKLTIVQMSRNLPGGVLVVFAGQASNPAQRIVGIIKAETHSGF